MSVSYEASLKATRMQDVINAIDANASPGVVVIGTAAMNATLARVTLQKPSFSQSGGVITMLGVPLSHAAIAAGTAAAAIIQDGGGNTIVTGLTVSTGGADINLDSVSIAIGQNVTLTSGSISHSP
jgi:hypothetical protein